LSIDTIAVIGSGLMGRGIAYVAAVGGFQTRVFDVAPEALERALGQIQKDLDEGVSRGKLSGEDAANARARIRGVSSLEEATAGVDFVIEAVPEEIGLKLRTFARLDELCPERVVLATNTSALSVTEIAAAARSCPSRVLGMHFFNPVPKMKLVEIVRALETSAHAIEMTTRVAQQMKKETVLV
jgi:3-hydroxybutyryl-CoA dehydrogenase